MRIDRQSEQAVEDFEPAAAPAAAQSPAPSAAQQAALDQAGVTSASAFAEPAAAPVSAPPAATPAADGPTVRASQLQNGTASLDAAAAAAPVVLYAAPTDTGNLAKIMSGADGQVPLTRDQIVQTVTAAFPESASLIAAGVTDASLAQAFSSVISAHATAGTKDVSINLVGFESHTEDVPSGEYTVPTTITTPSSTPTSFKASLAVGADGKVNGQTLSVDSAELADLKPYPDGNSAQHIKLKYDVVGDPGNLANLMAAHGDQPALPRQAIVDTIVAAMPAAKELIAAGVTDDSLARAFSQVISARNTPGEKTLSLDLVPLITTTTESPAWGEYTPPPVTTVTPADHPTTLTGKISVSNDGKVNGSRLPADFATTIISASRSVPQEFKDATLKEVGLSDEWLQNASQEQKDYALAKIIDAKSTPGDKSLDLSYPYDAVQNFGESSTTVHTVAAGNISFKAGPGGLVNGKPLTAEVAFSATQAVEAMPLAVRRGSLQTLGFPADAISKASADQQKYALIKTRVSTATPGTTQFEVHMGGDKYAVGLKISADHKIEGAGVQFIPPPPKKSWWKSVVSIVCTVVSIVFPVAAPICMAINAGIAISNGAKGLGLIAAVAGAAAGIADISGFAGMAQTLSTAATTIGSVNSAINAFQHGDFLGALSSAVSAGAGMAGGFSELGSLGETLQTVSTVARAGSGLIGALKTGDPLALLSAGANAAGAFGKALDFDVPDSLATIGRVASTARALEKGDYIGVLNGVNDLTGNFKNVDRLTGAANSIATGFNNAVSTLGTGALPSLVGPPDESTLVPFSDTAISTVNAVTDATAAFVGPPSPDADTTALTSVLSLTGNDDDGDVITTGPAQTGSQGDVRRVDNAIDAAGPQPLTTLPATGPQPDDEFSGVRTNTLVGGVTDLRRIDNATLPELRAVKPGDTLSAIAAQTLGDANRWPELYAYNAQVIGTNPNDLRVGVNLEIPPSDFTLPASSRNALFTAAYIPPTVPVSTPGGIEWGSQLGSVFEGPSFADGWVGSSLKTAQPAQSFVDDRTMLTRLTSGIDSWKRELGGSLSDAGSLLARATTNPDLSFDERLTLFGDAKDSLTRAALSGVLLPAANVTGVTDAITAAFGIDLNMIGIIDANTGLPVDPNVGATERLISSIATAMSVMPLGGRVAAGELRASAPILKGEMRGTAGRDVTGLFVGEDRTLQFMGSTRPRGNTVEIYDIGLFPEGLEGMRTTAGSQDMLLIKDSILDWAKGQGFENVRLTWSRAGQEIFGTTAHAGAQFDIVLNTSTGQRVRGVRARVDGP